MSALTASPWTVAPRLEALSRPAGCWAQVSLDLNLDEVDEADEDTFNRILWHSARASTRPIRAQRCRPIIDETAGAGGPYFCWLVS